MTSIQAIWTIIFVITVILFIGVEIVVIIGGARDLIYMMKYLIKNITIDE